jgi:CBS domain containing-hemolysin-like protein
MNIFLFLASTDITAPALIGTIAFALAFAAITILHIVLGELAHGEEELWLILDESAKAARICQVSHEIVANAFEIRQRVVREVMTLRGEVGYLDTGLSFRENLQRAKAARHTQVAR